MEAGSYVNIVDIAEKLVFDIDDLSHMKQYINDYIMYQH